jgi:Ti-type conjugative transfer relaxase TraA
MALFHLSAQIIARSNGRSAVAAAAYRAAAKLHDARLDRHHDFTAKTGVIHSSILLPAEAPDALGERERLWNAVEAAEKRKDAQLAREVELALPQELSDAANIALARVFVQEAFVSRGMIADLCVHKPVVDGQARPHAHVLLTMRSVGETGFGAKVRAWNGSDLLLGWRELLAVRTNQQLAAHGRAERVDHRSYAARGIDLEPQTKIGGAAQRREGQGAPAERVEQHRGIARRNGARLAREPELALLILTEQHSTFTRAELARLIVRHTDGAAQFASVLAKVEASPELVRLGRDGQGQERFTSRAMLSCEQRLAAHAAALMADRRHGLDPADLEHGLRHTALGAEQQDALRHVMRGPGLALVVGYAGSGKSTLLAAARAAWERAGYRVRGAALAGIAAESLEAGSGIASRTLASLEHAWGQGRDALSSRDVLVIDEAGMVGSRQLERVLGAARQAGAKVVLVGDPEQLQAIAAGAAFRALAARHGAAEITTVRRQTAEWMQQATKELATARTAAALARYEAAGMVHGSATHEEARARLIAQWEHDRQEQPEQSRMILAYTRADVAALNALARASLQASGELGAERIVPTERGSRALAVGERVLFLKNERSLGVKNGTLGTLRAMEGGRLTIQLDADGRAGTGALVQLELKDYAHLEHGYAATIHKAQGVTVERVYALASKHWDRHTSYVALTRHTERVELHYGRDTFQDQAQLAGRLGRERAKDSTLDYPLPDPKSGAGRDAAMAAAAEVAAQRLRAAREREARESRMLAAAKAVAQLLRGRQRERDDDRGR